MTIRYEAMIGGMLLGVMALSACSQDPAPVVYRSPSAARAMAQSAREEDPDGYVAPPAAPAVQNAQVPLVGVSELPPPGAGYTGTASREAPESGLTGPERGNAPFGRPTPPLEAPAPTREPYGAAARLEPAESLPPAPLAAPAYAPAPAPAAYAPAPSPPAYYAPPVVAVAPAVSPAPAPAAAPVATQFIWPVTNGSILYRFGARPDGKLNDGVNIAASEGEPIWAAADGSVIYASDELPSYGNMVIIRHDNGWMTAYANAGSIAVKKGDHVLQGQQVGYVGASGGVKTPQVHFVLRIGRKAVDPEQYLPAFSGGGAAVPGASPTRN